MCSTHISFLHVVCAFKATEQQQTSWFWQRRKDAKATRTTGNLGDTSFDNSDDKVEEALRLLTDKDAPPPPYIAKDLVGKDGKYIKEMEPFYRELPMWGPVGLYQ